RKVTKNRGHFPSTEAAGKLLWLAICNIEDKRALEREKERGKPGSQRRASGRLVEGQTVTNWKQALAQLTAAYPDRINPYLCTPRLHRPVDRPPPTKCTGRPRRAGCGRHHARSDRRTVHGASTSEPHPGYARESRSTPVGSPHPRRPRRG